MIDPLIEDLISLGDAAKLLPARRGGKRPHISCLYRWTKIGCRGVKLDFLSCGGTRVTSREAIVRFMEQLTALSAGGPILPRTPTQRLRDIRRDEQELDDAGI